MIAFPIWGPKLKADKPVGYVCVNSTGLGLPVWQKGRDPVWVDKKTMPGSGAAIIGDPDAIQAAGREWKLEGLTDLLTFLSMPVGEGHAAFTTAMGCQEHPDEAKWICKLFEGKVGAVLHDADTPGQRGALGWDKGGERRPGWAERIAGYATECRNVLLPYQVAETHGKDFRDFVAEGGTFNQLVELFEKAEAILPTEEHANEKDDDYTRLARVNLQRVKAMGGGIVFWGGSSYTYKEGQYRHQERDYLKSKLWTGVKFEMDRLYYEDKAAFDERKDPDAEPPVAKNVTPNMIKGVYEATAAMTRIAAGTELNTWLPTGEKRSYISMENGILDVDAVMAGKLDKCLLPHSPDWFSTTKFNYRFDPECRLPQVARVPRAQPGRRSAADQPAAGMDGLPAGGRQFEAQVPAPRGRGREREVRLRGWRPGGSRFEELLIPAPRAVRRQVPSVLHPGEDVSTSRPMRARSTGRPRE